MAERCKYCAGVGHHIGECQLLKYMTSTLKKDKIARKIWGAHKAKYKVNGKQKCIKEAAEAYLPQYKLRSDKN